MANTGPQNLADNAKTDNQQPIAPASINIGNVNINDTRAKYQLRGNGIFSDYRIINRYEKDGRIYMAGITSPNGFNGDSTAFFEMASPTLLWICDWTAERTGDKPLIPNPIIKDSNYVLMDFHIETDSLDLEGDGITLRWRISGTYVYGAKNQKTSLAWFGKPPWMDESPDRFVSAQQFTDGLSTAASSGITKLGDLVKSLLTKTINSVAPGTPGPR